MLIPSLSNSISLISALNIPKSPDLTSVIITNPVDLLNTGFNQNCTVAVSNINVSASDSITFGVEIVNARQPWSAVASSADGTRLFAAVNGGSIYISTNSGVIWSAASAPATNWLALASSADGATLVALANNGSIYTSLDSGATWKGTNLTEASTSLYANGAVASSTDGSELLAALYGGYIYADPIALLRPTLNILTAGSNVILTWSTQVEGFNLQGNGSGLNSAWANVTTTPFVTNNENQVILPLTNGSCFFRLKK